MLVSRIMEVRFMVLPPREHRQWHVNVRDIRHVAVKPDDIVPSANLFSFQRKR